MTKKSAPFAFVNIVRADAEEIVTALKKARTVHADGDIDAAGHEIEDVVRSVLSRRLPKRYDLGQGHVVDHGWTSSSEWDIVIADLSAGSSFFRLGDGTRYYPYEGVYAVGSVKSRFRRDKKPLQELIAAVTALRSLRRERTPANYIAGLGPVPQVDGDWPYRNPLFSFGIFVEGGDVGMADITAAYAGVPWACIPNILCFLDTGVAILRTKASRNFEVVPEFVTTGADTHEWALLAMGSEHDRAAANLATLEWALSTHLDSTALMPATAVRLQAYLANAGLITVSESIAAPAARPPGDVRPDKLRG